MDDKDRQEFINKVFMSIIILLLIIYCALGISDATQKDIVMYGRPDGMHVVIDGNERVYDY